MNLGRLALRNISGSAFRSGVVLCCALVVAGMALSITLIIRGAEESLRLGAERLGADVLVLPKGTESRVETALLMGKPTTIWMPTNTLDKVAAVPGVERVSPQFYLASLANASCCTVSEMFLVVFDPRTDFTVQPWLEKTIGHSLKLGEVVGGWCVFVPEGEQNIVLYNYILTLKANLAETGTGLDQTMFMSIDTARDMARMSVTRALAPLVIPDDSISTVMVKAQPGVDREELARRIAEAVPEVAAIASADIFQSFRVQMAGWLSGMLLVLGITWALAVLLIGLIFSMTANARRRELGVLRVLGATRRFVFASVLAEAATLAVVGGLAGIILAAVSTALFHNLIVISMGIPFKFPSLLAFLALIGIGLGAALVTVALAALLPALRVSRQEPAIAMRE